MSDKIFLLPWRKCKFRLLSPHLRLVSQTVENWAQNRGQGEHILIHSRARICFLPVLGIRTDYKGSRQFSAHTNLLCFLRVLAVLLVMHSSRGTGTCSLRRSQRLLPRQHDRSTRTLARFCRPNLSLWSHETTWQNLRGIVNWIYVFSRRLWRLKLGKGPREWTWNPSAVIRAEPKRRAFVGRMYAIYVN